ncbi:MAG TPA: MarR family transcriptional regulator [Spirochaetia bacterium]|nr:MarR family transcriptional regulator [Spirochaetia bacterium]
MKSTETNGKSTSEKSLRAQLISDLAKLGEVASTDGALFHQRVAEKYSLGLTDMKALSILLGEGPMAAGKIAARLALTTGAVTSVIDRLEKRGFVHRAQDPDDRRKVMVEVNTASLAGGPNYYESIGEAFVRLHETYTTEQLEFLVEYHRAGIELTRQQIAELAQGRGARATADEQDRADAVVRRNRD